ncbi:MAG: hypothetical protein A3K19_17295 [Lentisphaerae bacterium RIFOXYB12_FULL_65_16]|nr:MAG: hypothetical protein A3K18_09145 [Lentisphaerae bacterium RIFOXYA12_64_32]OGV85621.1 MAG: hypothetical protein A3K19_17295 [Lentisphaerae bacterium RIFOXYB12_FULL_65_16]
MCVLAAYLGDRPAAPILLEMLEKQEGLAGGYYAGLATVHDGKLLFRKVVGDVAALRRQTDAAALPGTVGIAHSRTPSGGNVEWGHPFVDCRQQMAYVAQGAPGFFTTRTDMPTFGNALLAKGHTFRSTCAEKVGNYPGLNNGKFVHLSDVMCHLIEDEQQAGLSLLEAMRTAFTRMPGEICGICLHCETPDRLVVAAINQSIVIGRDDASVYLCSTGLALPESVTWRLQMPPNTAAAVTRSDLTLRPFDPSAVPVVSAHPSLDADAFALESLRNTPGQTWGALFGKLREKLWPGGGLTVTAPAVNIIENLVRTSRIRLETHQVPGMFNRGTTPQVRVFASE